MEINDSSKMLGSSIKFARSTMRQYKMFASTMEITGAIVATSTGITKQISQINQVAEMFGMTMQAFNDVASITKRQIDIANMVEATMSFNANISGIAAAAKMAASFDIATALSCIDVQPNSIKNIVWATTLSINNDHLAESKRLSPKNNSVSTDLLASITVADPEDKCVDDNIWNRIKEIFPLAVIRNMTKKDRQFFISILIPVILFCLNCLINNETSHQDAERAHMDAIVSHQDAVEQNRLSKEILNELKARPVTPSDSYFPR